MEKIKIIWESKLSQIENEKIPYFQSSSIPICLLYLYKNCKKKMETSTVVAGKHFQILYNLCYSVHTMSTLEKQLDLREKTTHLGAKGKAVYANHMGQREGRAMFISISPS